MGRTPALEGWTPTLDVTYWMRLEFDDGTLLLRDALGDILSVEWNTRAREQVRRPYRSLLD